MVRRLSAEPGVFIGTQSGERVEGSSAVWESRGPCAQGLQHPLWDATDLRARACAPVSVPQ